MAAKKGSVQKSMLYRFASSANHFIRILILVGASLPIYAFSEQQEPNWWSAGFFLDNDLFAGQDDGYTNGVRLSFVSPDLASFDQDDDLPKWLRTVNRNIKPIGSDSKDILRNMVVTVGQQMYTPNERFINRTDLVEEDRPYAGWLYMGFGYQLRSNHHLETAIVNIGVVGPASYAQQAQDLVHDLRGFEKFEGWDNQLENELGLQVLYSQKRRTPRHKISKTLSTDLIHYWGGSLGNVATYTEAGIEWRLGWSLPDNFGTSSASPGGDSSSPGSWRDSRIQNKLLGGIHAYVAANGRWVLHDITLDGNTFTDSHSVDKEPLIGSIAAGFVMTSGRWQLGFSRVYISKEFENQPDTRGYGSVALSYTYSFK